MDDFNSETDSDYTSYWRDWVRFLNFSKIHSLLAWRDVEAQDLKGTGHAYIWNLHAREC